jgi:hypothetical protein
VEKRE